MKGKFELPEGVIQNEIAAGVFEENQNAWSCN